MTLDEFEEALSDVGPGQGVRVPYEIFAMLWPPDVSDFGAQDAARAFARKHRVKIDNRPDDGAVWFYKDA